MRIFIAVNINAQVRRQIGQIQESLQRATGLKKGPVKWIRPELIHLTLKFLGEVRDQAVTDVCRIVEQTATGHSSFEMVVQDLGTFGRPPRVLWTGIGPCPELMQLQEDLENRLAAAGWPKENRNFSAHLTLCRIKDGKAGSRLARAVEKQTSQTLGTVCVDEVIVYESQLTSEGPIYTAVGRYDLQG